MFKKILHFIILLICCQWVYLSFNSIYEPFAPLTKLFSFPEGAFFGSNPEDRLEFDQSGHSATVSFDEFGIPTIEGKNANDVSYALGYMHARDRYFQMELITRTVQGKLSEILGIQTLNNDIFWVPMEAEKIAKEQLASMKKEDPNMYQYLMNYNQGVNFYLDNEKASEQFIEYSLINEKPRKWEDHYPLLLSFYMSYMLAYDNSDVAWTEELQKMPDEVLENFFSDDTLNYPYIHGSQFQSDQVQEQKSLDILNAKATPFDQKKLEKDLSLGSNNWVIAASKSKHKKAILANDTHLDILIPNPWYQAHLICPEFHVQGFTIPCMPYVISGNNASISWGITNAHWDEVDVFKMALTDDKKSYLMDGKEEKIEFHKHIIEVRHTSNHQFESMHTKQGILQETKNGYYAEYWYPLHFTKVNKTFAQLAVAENRDDFTNALSGYSFPAQNFVYADKKGNIGMISAGLMPARNKNYKGEILDGKVSFPKKLIAFKDLPASFNPETAFLGSANQIPAKSNYYVNHYFTDKTRAERIRQLLSENSEIGVSQMESFQTDKIDLAALEVVSLYKQQKLSKKQSRFLKVLQKWDGKMSPDTREPVVYYYVQHAIKQQVNNFLNKNYDIRWNPSFANMLKTLKKESFTIKGKTFQSKEFLVTALDTAMTWFQKFSNERVVYGEIAPFHMDHLLRIPGFGRLIGDKGGSGNTLDVNAYGQHGASMRLIVEMGDIPVIKTILAGGQSGRITSRHYDDQVQLWNKGKYVDIPFKKTQASTQKSIIFKK